MATKKPDKKDTKTKTVNNKNQTFYDKIKQEAREQGVRGLASRARDWYRDQVKSMGRSITPAKALQAGRTFSADNIGIGSMFFYWYDPKLKDKLPYYDAFPLTIVLNRYKDGFLGLNLHYLPPDVRAQFLSKLMDFATNPKLTKETRLQVTYEFLRASSKYKEFEPCLHRYLYSHLVTAPTRVLPEDWIMAVFLPVARFKKARASRVWNDSMKGKKR